VEKINNFLKEVMRVWGKSRTPRLAAALAYYSLFSLAPMLYIALTVAGMFLEDFNATDRLYTQLEIVLGGETVNLLKSVVNSLASANSTTGTLTSLIGLAALIFAATGLFAQLKDALNTIWEVHTTRNNSALQLVKDRLLAFVMVLGAGILIVIAAFANLVVTLLASFLHFNGPISWVNNGVMLILVMISLTLLYKILPDSKIHWGDVWLGASITSILLLIGSRLMGFYIGLSNLGSAFGAAGALAVLLVGVYYLTQIFLLGAVFTKVYARTFGSQKVEHSADYQQGAFNI
jgi:membrane protein